MSILRRSRFTALVRRQLDLFAEDETQLLTEADEAERAYDAAERRAAEEAYGDFQLVLDATAERLIELRETYAATLDADLATEYEAVFDREAAKRLPRLRGRL